MAPAIPAGTTLYRGQSFVSNKDRENFVKLAESKGSLTEKSFMSTTLDANYASSFAAAPHRGDNGADYGGVVWKLTPAKGARGGFTGGQNENSYLIQRESKIQITSVAKSEGGYMLVEGVLHTPD
jgi:hypothetical protein